MIKILDKELDDWDLDYIYPETLCEIVSDARVAEFLKEQCNINLCEDQYPDGIKVTCKDITCHTSLGCAIDKTLTEINIWLSQWNDNHTPDRYEPYRNGDNLYVLGFNGGIVVFPQPEQDTNRLVFLTITEKHGRWVIRGSSNKPELYTDTSLIDDLTFCFEIAEDYLLKYATQGDVYDESNIIFTLPWID